MIKFLFFLPIYTICSISSVTLAQGSDPFIMIRRGDLEGLRRILTQDGSLIDKTSEDHKTLLIDSAFRGNPKIAEFLIKKNPALIDRKDKANHTALYYAILNSQEKTALLLIENQADLTLLYDGPKNTILHMASRTEMVKVVEKLVKKSEKLLNQQNDHGEPPLFDAVRSSQTKVAGALLALGANKNIRNKKGETVTDLIDPQTDKKLYRLFRSHEN